MLFLIFVSVTLLTLIGRVVGCIFDMPACFRYESYVPVTFGFVAARIGSS